MELIPREKIWTRKSTKESIDELMRIVAESEHTVTRENVETLWADYSDDVGDDWLPLGEDAYVLEALVECSVPPLDYLRNSGIKDMTRILNTVRETCDIRVNSWISSAPDSTDEHILCCYLDIGSEAEQDDLTRALFSNASVVINDALEEIMEYLKRNEIGFIVNSRDNGVGMMMKIDGEPA